MDPGVHVRRARADDADFLAAMLAEAVAWRAEAVASVDEVMADPQFARYVAGWPRPGDFGVVAVDASDRLGAAWCRFFTDDDRGFGFDAADVPELSIAVVAGRRGQGIGRALLRALLRESTARGCDAVSLSVEPDNPARRLYEAVGFRVVETAGGAWTMVAAVGSR
jgi:ribosomal protein S18 acetylase RimI-like enzyme